MGTQIIQENVNEDSVSEEVKEDVTAVKKGYKQAKDEK